MSSQTVENLNVLQTAYYAGGCFWGVEYYMRRTMGVVGVDPGYMGGHLANPTYTQVKSHTTGHAETVRVVFDPTKCSYEELTKLFFEIHDPTQLNRQGVDVGDQYRSVIFYCDEEQRLVAQRLIDELRSKGYDVVTRLEPATHFWIAEEYHRNYLDRRGEEPECHRRERRF